MCSSWSSARRGSCAACSADRGRWWRSSRCSRAGPERARAFAGQALSFAAAALAVLMALAELAAPWLAQALAGGMLNGLGRLGAVLGFALALLAQMLFCSEGRVSRSPARGCAFAARGMGRNPASPPFFDSLRRRNREESPTRGASRRGDDPREGPGRRCRGGLAR